MAKQREYVFLCMGEDCCKKGAERLKKSIKHLRKEDKRFKNLQVVKTYCMDQCKKGPNLIIHDKMYHDVSDLIELLKERENL